MTPSEKESCYGCSFCGMDMEPYCANRDVQSLRTKETGRNYPWGLDVGKAYPLCKGEFHVERDSLATYKPVEKSSPLAFDQLRAANRARIPLFRNSKGELAHADSEGRDWSPAEWLEAIVGELGEYANKRKKYRHPSISAWYRFGRVCS